MEKSVRASDLASSYPLPSSSAENTINSMGPIKGKKLRLFGFDIDPSINGGKCTSHYVKVLEIANSASMDLLGEQNLERESSERDCLKEKKYECQFCCKAYANLQALGGHQNAHRKERLKKRKMQLKLRKLSIKLYLHSLQFPARHYK